MIETYIPIERIKRLRKRAERLTEKLPRQETRGWTQSGFDPAKLLALFPSLRLREGYVLRAYCCRSGGNGNGRICAFPKDAVTELWVPGLPVGEDLFSVHPASALEELMDAIEGDGTPWSYFCASLFAREAEEFGAVWHGVDWGSHVIIDRDQLGPLTSEWEWLTEEPASWSPVVALEEERVIVRFYTYCGRYREAVYEHIDTYPSGSCRCVRKTRQVAVGEGGYIF